MAIRTSNGRIPVLAALTVLLAAMPARADDFLDRLHNTGVDAAGNLVEPGAVTSGWALTEQPGFDYPPGAPPYRYYDGAYFLDEPDSAWVSPTASGNAGELGDYVYEMYFDMSGLDPDTAVIEGQFGTDNQGAIWLNTNAPVATTGGRPGFSSPWAFRIDSGFTAITNRVRVRVTNAGDPTAIYVRFTAATAEPDPCFGGCTDTRYGLSAPDSYIEETKLPGMHEYSENSFSGSYLHLRRGGGGAPWCGSGGEQRFSPIFGQVILRELDACVPTLSSGCPVSLVSEPQAHSFLSGGEVFDTVNIQPGNLSFLYNRVVRAALFTDPADADPPFQGVKGRGLRHLRPDGRTEIRWSDFRLDFSASPICCIDTGAPICEASLLGRYPVLGSGAGYILKTNGMAPWIFESDGSFSMDMDYQRPGQRHGVCANDRKVACSTPGSLNPASCVGPGAPFPCCTGAGTGICGSECGTGDSCDLRERGWRSFTFDTLSNGSPNPDYCNHSPLVLRGKRNQNCSILEHYNACLTLGPPETCVVAPGERIGRCSVSTSIACGLGPPPGDPGPQCASRTFGSFVRPDLNCDGVEDPTLDTNGDGQADLVADLCPSFSEGNPFADTDDDGRGDECECSDQNADGRTSVSDLVAINLALFNPALRTELCDGNGDLLCSVSDIVAANREIFVPGSATCARQPIPCGNGALEAGEVCDDGDRVDGDECNNICSGGKPGTCGNGRRELSERCDDGDRIDVDECNNTCTGGTANTCGNGVSEGAEICDDGDRVNGVECNSTCSGGFPFTCGNGANDGAEICDDGDRVDANSCTTSCTSGRPRTCGDGIRDDGEICDDGDRYDDNPCDTGCTGGTGCGDGDLDPGEICDDGNGIEGDGCSNQCIP